MHKDSVIYAQDLELNNNYNNLGRRDSFGKTTTLDAREI